MNKIYRIWTIGMYDLVEIVGVFQPKEKVEKDEIVGEKFSSKLILATSREEAREKYLNAVDKEKLTKKVIDEAEREARWASIAGGRKTARNVREYLQYEEVTNTVTFSQMMADMSVEDFSIWCKEHMGDIDIRG